MTNVYTAVYVYMYGTAPRGFVLFLAKIFAFTKFGHQHLHVHVHGSQRFNES